MECSDFLAHCLTPRDWADRRAACLKQRDVTTENETQLPRATALDWDRNVRCPCGGSPYCSSTARFRLRSQGLHLGIATATVFGSILGGVNCGSVIELRLCPKMHIARTRVHTLTDCLSQFPRISSSSITALRDEEEGFA